MWNKLRSIDPSKRNSFIRILVAIWLTTYLFSCGPVKDAPPAPVPYVKAEPNTSNTLRNPPPPPDQDPIPPAQLNLAWCPSSSPEVTSYALYQDGVMIVETTDVRAGVNNLSPGHLYTFYVTAKATGDDGLPVESDPSKALKFIVPVLAINTQEVSFTIPEPQYQSNQVFVLESTESLSNPVWVPEPYTIEGTTAHASLPVVTGAAKFYRVRISFTPDVGCP